IVAMIMTKRMTVNVPLCDQHKRHWFNRNLFAFGGLAFVLLALFGLVAMIDEHRDLAGIGFGLLGLAFLAWLVGLVIISFTAIRPKEITDDWIRLTKISPVFIEALDKARAQREDEREHDYPFVRQPQRDDRFYDPHREHPHQPPSDAFREGRY